MDMSLPILCRTKCKMQAECSWEIYTIVFVVQMERESLLGLKDGEDSRIIRIRPKGGVGAAESAGQLLEVGRQTPQPGIQSGGQTQQEIDQHMEELLKPLRRCSRA